MASTQSTPWLAETGHCYTGLSTTSYYQNELPLVLPPIRELLRPPTEAPVIEQLASRPFWPQTSIQFPRSGSEYAWPEKPAWQLQSNEPGIRYSVFSRYADKELPDGKDGYEQSAQCVFRHWDPFEPNNFLQGLGRAVESNKTAQHGCQAFSGHLTQKTQAEDDDMHQAATALYDNHSQAYEPEASPTTNLQRMKSPKAGAQLDFTNNMSPITKLPAFSCEPKTVNTHGTIITASLQRQQQEESGMTLDLGETKLAYIGVRNFPNEGRFHLYEGGYRIPTEIHGQPVNPQWGLTKAKAPRRRLARACSSCKKKKVRCQPSTQGCLQCRVLKKVCEI